MKRIVITVIIAGIISLGAWYLLIGRNASENGLLHAPRANSAVDRELFTQDGAVQNLSDQGSAPLASADVVVYSNDEFHFLFNHSKDLAVAEHDEGDGAKSIVFENEDLSKGFQIFVTPYTEATITRARFQMDQPSGALNDPVAVTVDGASGMMFYGRNDDIGETKEVWFIKNGYLYEVFTYKTLEADLMAVLQTWKFK